MHDDGRLIDDALQNVPLPPAWPEGVRPEALFADEQLDRMLVAMVVPADLGERIRAGLDAQPTWRRDGTIDLERFSEKVVASADGSPVPLAAGRSDRLARWVKGFLRPAREVASVAAALAVVGLLAGAGIEFSRRLEMPRAAGGRDPLAAAGKWPASLAPEGRPDEVHAAGRAGKPGVSDPGLVADPSDRLVAAAPTPANADPPVGSTAAPLLELADRGPAGLFPAAEPEPAETMVVRGAAVWQDERSGSPGLPAMTTVEIPSAARRRVPRLPGYDLSFELTTGEQPFVTPAVADQLAVDLPPLTLGTGGYEALVAGRGRGRGRIRAEEVLAAMPAAALAEGSDRPMGLTIHAVRSRHPAGEPSLLVEVAVSAGPLERPASAPPREVTLVLDQAAGGDPEAWPRICRGVAALAGNLAAADRVTVVLCGTRARVAARAVAAHQLAELAADVERQPAAASSDLDAGLALAGGSGRVVVVAHAVSLAEVRGEAREALAAWHAALAAAGGDTLTSSPSGGRRFVILDAATLSPASRSEPTFGRTGADAVSIRRAILRQATGQDTLVAADCRLEVRFDPRKVARYRLIGHRQSAVESLATTGAGSIDLHAGETARAVYEVVPLGSADLQGLVTAAASWQAAGRGRHWLHARGPASTTDLAAGLPSPHGCELLLAAGLGELAAGSAHLERPAVRMAALESLLEEWRNRGDLTSFAAALADGFELARSGRRIAR